MANKRKSARRFRKPNTGDQFVDEALLTLQKYVSGKYSIDQKATGNQEWWRLRHLDEAPNAEDKLYRSTSAWAVNSILNKHADIMDSFPKPNILPREADDEQEAKLLTSIVPATLEQNDYEQTYRQMGWDFCIDGAAITGVFWDSSKHDGLGDIAITNIDVHNLFWQPGINDIQDSAAVFHVCLEDVDSIKRRFPKLKDIGPHDTGKVQQYLHDDSIDTTNCAEVINMYYKRTLEIETEHDGLDEEGKPAKVKTVTTRTVLHLAIIVENKLAFCSEDEQGYEKGYYEHGKYPFIIRRAFPIKDTPWGFGYLDIMKSPQLYIDSMDDDIMTIVDMKARPRFWAKKNANIDVSQFADWNQQIVEVASGDLGEAVRQIEVYDVPAGVMEHRANKIEELKETSGNRDFNQGGVSGGITAASAVAALQEAGSKLSRDMNKELYRGSREEFLQVIELIRQFYTEPRSFRVTGPNMDVRFIQYSSASIVEDDIPLPDGSVRHRRAIFDISISAEKQNPFNRAAQNELVKELYGMGMFDPNNTLPAMTALNAMDFDGKDKILQEIQQNSIMLRQYNAAMQMIQQLAMSNPMIMQMAVQMGVFDPETAAQMTMAAAGPAPGEEGEEPAGDTAPERAANRLAQGDRLSRIRQQTANLASPQ